MLQSRRFISSVSFTLVAGILWALFLANVPHAHDELHHDADEENHECVVTIFQGANCESAGKPVSAPQPVGSVGIRNLCHIPARNVVALFLVTCVMEHA